MTLKDRLSGDLKDAMRESDALRRDVLRSLITAITRAEIPGIEVEDAEAARRALTDEEAERIVQQQAKQRRDSIDAFRKAGRTELADRESSELTIIETYLPQQMSREEITAEVRAVLAETGASGPGDKAKVMPPAMARMKGRADGRLINEVVTELLAGG